MRIDRIFGDSREHSLKQSQTPQEKKLLSYAKDGRNTVAESRSIAHKAVAKRKANANRALRRAEAVADARAARNPDDADDFVPRVGRKSWQKIPDAPLAEYVAARLGNRKARGMNASEKRGSLLTDGRTKAHVRPFVLNGSTGNGSKPT
jgi:hypothetical protein